MFPYLYTYFVKVLLLKRFYLVGDKLRTSTNCAQLLAKFVINDTNGYADSKFLQLVVNLFFLSDFPVTEVKQSPLSLTGIDVYFFLQPGRTCNSFPFI